VIITIMGYLGTFLKKRLKRYYQPLVSTKINKYLIHTPFWPLCFHIELLERRIRQLLGIYGTERVVEYPWVLQNLGIKNGRILDVGCCQSFFSHELIRRGYEVYGVDVGPYPEKHPKMCFFQADAINIPVIDNFFDRIVAVSTIEHIGLGVRDGAALP
jgi:2-polyprenyl-3-methyl-5-hydroxy-6-metoxy-1,4-benzoquinol methylase